MLARDCGMYLLQPWGGGGGNKGDLWVVSGGGCGWDYRKEDLFHTVSFCISDFNMDT